MLAGTVEAPSDINDHDLPSGDSEWVDLAPDDPDAHFRCQMPEDRYYTSEDGECPVCGMFLEEHDPEEWAEEHPVESEEVHESSH